MLNDRQKRFLDTYASNGGNASKAARQVGYSPAGGGDRVIACRLLKKPEAIEYLHTLLLRNLTADAPYAVNTIRKLAEEASSEQVRLLACKELLDRAGFKLAERHEFIVRDERSDEEVEASIRANLAELGITEQNVIDGEVVEH